MENDIFFGNKNAKKLAVLIDPVKFSFSNHFVSVINDTQPDYIFVGGSGEIDIDLFDSTIQYLKQNLNIPVIIFPGNNKQRSTKADGLLLLSVFQAKEKEYIIGQLIKVAKDLIMEKVPLFPTLYLLIDGLKETSTMKALDLDSSKMLSSFEKIEELILTAKILNFKYVYLEAGSGAQKPVSEDIIYKSKHLLDKEILIVGGGIRSNEQLYKAYQAGADIVVIGNSLETQPLLLNEFIKIRNSFLK